MKKRPTETIHVRLEPATVRAVDELLAARAAEAPHAAWTRSALLRELIATAIRTAA
jgi:hypothetical protein